MNNKRIAQAVANLDAWLQSMHSFSGYGGPVSHWWHSSFRFTGPALDWRYEGICSGYRMLHERTGDCGALECLRSAAGDVMAGQERAGNYLCSCFEMNPGTLGTPHEAAASLGLITAVPYLENAEFAISTARRNIRNLISQLWDPCAHAFDDRPGVRSRVPNKLATMTAALIELAEISKDMSLLPYASQALEGLVAYQVKSGVNQGAVHQFAPECMAGDGRFFPYYNARCIPGLLAGAQTFGESRFAEAAAEILRFLQRTMYTDGSWPQIIYADGSRAEWPRWLAGSADILWGFHLLRHRLPEVALDRLLNSQLPSGGFATGEGFALRPEIRRTIRAMKKSPCQVRKTAGLARCGAPYVPDFRDLTPVVGWNDKVFRLLTSQLEVGSALPSPSNSHTLAPVMVGRSVMTFEESPTSMRISTESGAPAYAWNKGDAWASASNEIALQ